MKRLALSLLSVLLLGGILAGCGGGQAPAGQSGSPAPAAELVTLKVGAVPTPHAELLELIKPAAEKEGIKIEIVEFTDYVKPNQALWEKELDANFFQHIPYMTTFAADHGMELVSVGPVHIEPLSLYSVKVDSVADLPDGATITIPDDPSNTGRALYLLAQNGLITLKDGVGIKATPEDVAENPKNLKIELLNAEVLPRTLEDADAAVINGNYYLEAEKNLGVKAAVLARETAKDNPYANVLAVRKGDENRPEVQKLLKLLQSPEVKQFIEKTYNGVVIPAF